MKSTISSQQKALIFTFKSVGRNQSRCHTSFFSRSGGVYAATRRKTFVLIDSFESSSLKRLRAIWSDGAIKKKPSEGKPSGLLFALNSTSAIQATLRAA